MRFMFYQCPSHCCRSWNSTEVDISTIQTRLALIRETISILDSPNSPLIDEIKTLENTLPNLDSEWRKESVLAKQRLCILTVKPYTEASITVREDDTTLHQIGLCEENSQNNYSQILDIMFFLIRILEGQNSVNISCLEQISVKRRQINTVNTLDTDIPKDARQQLTELLNQNISQIRLISPPAKYRITVTKHH